MNHGSLFSGIGGFDLAAERMGWKNIFHCEWNPFGKKVLKHHFPKSISYDDITKTDFTIHRGEIDILTGGFPCQPYSVAGKRKGKEDERHLWPEMLRAIREIQPRYVVGENVGGIISWNGGLVFEEVQTDMEAAGYEVWAYVLPACGVDAPHRRDRVWFVANAKSSRIDREYRNDKCKRTTNGHRNDQSNGRSSNQRSTPHSHNQRNTTGLGQVQGTNEEIPKRHDNAELSNTGSGDVADSTSEGSGWELQQRQEEGEFRGCDSATTTNTHSGRFTGKEHRQTEPGRLTETSLPGDWQNFPTQSPICGRNDGLPTRLDGITFSKWRNESIKAYGNAIVPQVAFEIFKAIQSTQCQ